MKLLLYLYICVRAALALQKLDTVYEWKYIDYLWESEEQKANYTRDINYFDVKDVFPVDVVVAQDGRVFITTLGKNGKVPSVSVVSDVVGPGGPLLQPYPDWSFHDGRRRNSCLSIAAAYHITIYKDHLVVVDAGYFDTNSSCPMQILLFNLTTNTARSQMQAFEKIAPVEQGRGLLMAPVIEKRPSDNTTVAYVVDAHGEQLIRIAEGSTFTVFNQQLEVLKPEKENIVVEIAGEKVDLGVNLISMVLSPDVMDERRRLYIRPLASRSLYAIYTDKIKESFASNDLNKTLVNRKLEPKVAKNMLPSQATAMTMNSDGTLFLGLTKDIAIACWNQYRPMNADNLEIVAQDDVRLQFASGMKVVPKTRSSSNLEEELWVLTNRFHKVVLNKLNFDDINFRILKGSVKNLTQGSKCQKPAIKN